VTRPTRIELLLLIGCARVHTPAAPVRPLEYTIVDTTMNIEAAFPDGTRERYHVPAPGRARPLSTVLRHATGPFRLRAPKTFVTALSRDGDAYVGELDDLEAPFAIGETRTFGALDVVTLPGSRASTDDEIANWLQRSYRAVEKYYARPPFAKMLIFVESAHRSEIFGLADHHGTGSITLQFGPTSAVDGDDDWVATHEMLHFAYPFVGRQDAWFSEGMATYVEPIARVRAGDLDERTMWTEMIRGLAKGVPGPGDTWAGTYWGGALWYFAVDVELRVRTNNARGLEHALRAFYGGFSTVDEVIAKADVATGTTVLHDLRDKPIDLEPLLTRLGIVRNGDSITFDTSAELAHVRRAITKRAE
jgi:hypothetical protein